MDKNFKVHQATRDFGFGEGDDRWPSSKVAYDPLDVDPEVVYNPSTKYGGNTPPPFADPDSLGVGAAGEKPTNAVDLAAESRNNDRHAKPTGYGDGFMGKPST